ncbi:MAG TPA: hypothetical protein VGS80_19110 [Ktedonobacterales bacterium]|nr:hypothetical protein [Ktedonobacterales bacterium]
MGDASFSTTWMQVAVAGTSRTGTRAGVLGERIERGPSIVAERARWSAPLPD